jgi:hypothetical protein
MGKCKAAIGGGGEILRLSFWSLCEDHLSHARDAHVRQKEILDDHGRCGKRTTEPHCPRYQPSPIVAVEAQSLLSAWKHYTGVPSPVVPT